MEDKEYTVTILLNEYKELIEDRTRLYDLIDFIFNNCDYSNILNSLEINENRLNNYLKAIWSFNYNKTIEKLKK